MPSDQHTQCFARSSIQFKMSSWLKVCPIQPIPNILVWPTTDRHNAEQLLDKVGLGFSRWKHDLSKRIILSRIDWSERPTRRLSARIRNERSQYAKNDARRSKLGEAHFLLEVFDE